MAVRRLDFAVLGAARKTPGGGLSIPAALTRVGIFKYKLEDGTEIAELRPEDEVMHPDSLASLAAAPVTDLHPPMLVDSKSWKRYSVGHVRDTVKRDGDHVASELVIQDADVIARVEKGERKDVSCGYECEVFVEPGEFNGEKYDTIQRNIRYNHVALGPGGWGRAGSSVGLRLDSAGNLLPVEKKEGGDKAPTKKRPTMSLRLAQLLIIADTMTSARVDGVDFPIKTKEQQALAQQALAAAQERTRVQIKQDLDEAAAKAALDEAFTTIASLQAQLMQATVAVTNAQAVAQEATAASQAPTAEALDAMVVKRAALLDRASKLAPKEKFDGLSELEVMKKAILAKKPDTKFDGLSLDYIRGSFENLEVPADRVNNKREDSLDKTRRVTQTPREDGDQPVSRDEARNKARSAMSEAYKKPLTLQAK